MLIQAQIDDVIRKRRENESELSHADRSADVFRFKSFLVLRAPAETSPSSSGSWGLVRVGRGSGPIFLFSGPWSQGTGEAIIDPRSILEKNAKFCSFMIFVILDL